MRHIDKRAFEMLKSLLGLGESKAPEVVTVTGRSIENALPKSELHALTTPGEHRATSSPESILDALETFSRGKNPKEIKQQRLLETTLRSDTPEHLEATESKGLRDWWRGLSKTRKAAIGAALGVPVGASAFTSAYLVEQHLHKNKRKDKKSDEVDAHGGPAKEESAPRFVPGETKGDLGKGPKDESEDGGKDKDQHDKIHTFRSYPNNLTWPDEDPSADAGVKTPLPTEGGDAAKSDHEQSGSDKTKSSPEGASGKKDDHNMLTKRQAPSGAASRALSSFGSTVKAFGSKLWPFGRSSSSSTAAVESGAAGTLSRSASRIESGAAGPAIVDAKSLPWYKRPKVVAGLGAAAGVGSVLSVGVPILVHSHREQKKLDAETERLDKELEDRDKKGSSARLADPSGFTYASAQPVMLPGTKLPSTPSGAMGTAGPLLGGPVSSYPQGSLSNQVPGSIVPGSMVGLRARDVPDATPEPQDKVERSASPANGGQTIVKREHGCKKNAQARSVDASVSDLVLVKPHRIDEHDSEREHHHDARPAGLHDLDDPRWFDDEVTPLHIFGGPDKFAQSSPTFAPDRADDGDASISLASSSSDQRPSLVKRGMLNAIPAGVMNNPIFASKGFKYGLGGGLILFSGIRYHRLPSNFFGTGKRFDGPGAENVKARLDGMGLSIDKYGRLTKPLPM
ncbi:uncharacterized protein PFL1_03443 [Pseudozyma flocculosa PF-1]|uniref:Uncharacterized protein n=1 Tax=Pseudozyma flocculosa PF-1 TaxID=1277687 RepID=A0A061HEU8_9BASI|nr:uncharacterized protein PFL1_03443 [Pseudozyma flocculosa PF-1]EPQ29156.1 hypothetical protein PFL1_03443 [Pseudozyma flocculosa PF-1]